MDRDCSLEKSGEILEMSLTPIIINSKFMKRNGPGGGGGYGNFFWGERFFPDRLF